MVQKRHHVSHQVGDALAQVPLAPDIEGDGAEVTREGRALLEEPPAPEAQTSYQNERRSLAIDVIVYAGAARDHARHFVVASNQIRGPITTTTLYATYI